MTLLCAVAATDHGYTDGKIWRLLARLRQYGIDVIAVTDDQECVNVAALYGIPASLVPFTAHGISVQERVATMEAMKTATQHVMLPGTELPLWKVLMLDDFVGSLWLYNAFPADELPHFDAVLMPMMGPDNNTRSSCGLYTWVATAAKQRHIPIVGLEVSPLGNKHTLMRLPMDYYAVKTEWSRQILLADKAPPAHVAQMRAEEAYLLRMGVDDHYDAYLQQEGALREKLKVPVGRIIILIPHHVGFLYETRQMLRALAQAQLPPYSVVLWVDPLVSRRHLTEKEIVLKSYTDEINALPHVVIDERQIGIGLLTQCTDILLTAYAGVALEMVARTGRLGIVCQKAGLCGWHGAVCWEPEPDLIPAILETAVERGIVNPAGLLAMLAPVVQGQAADGTAS